MGELWTPQTIFRKQSLRIGDDSLRLPRKRNMWVEGEMQIKNELHAGCGMEEDKFLFEESCLRAY